MSNLADEVFIQYRADGFSYNKIFAETGVSKPTLLKMGKRLEAEIRIRRAAETESLLESYSALKRQRIVILGKKLKELMERADAGIATLGPKAALHLLPKYLKALRAEDFDLEAQLKMTPEIVEEVDNKKELDDLH